MSVSIGVSISEELLVLLEMMGGSLLKGQCHAIWQLYKKLEGVFASIEFQNVLAWLLKTI